MIALDKKEGRLIWQSKELKNKAPYSSIMPAQIHGVRQYIQNSYVDDLAGGASSGFSAKDGKVLWSMPIFKGDLLRHLSPTPIVSGNLVYVTTYVTQPRRLSLLRNRQSLQSQGPIFPGKSKSHEKQSWRRGLDRRPCLRFFGRYRLVLPGF